MNLYNFGLYDLNFSNFIPVQSKCEVFSKINWEKAKARFYIRLTSIKWSKQKI